MCVEKKICETKVKRKIRKMNVKFRNFTFVVVSFALLATCERYVFFFSIQNLWMKVIVDYIEILFAILTMLQSKNLFYWCCNFEFISRNTNASYVKKYQVSIDDNVRIIAISNLRYLQRDETELEQKMTNEHWYNLNKNEWIKLLAIFKMEKT